jgi:hypothetical protein
MSAFSISGFRPAAGAALPLDAEIGYVLTLWRTTMAKANRAATVGLCEDVSIRLEQLRLLRYQKRAHAIKVSRVDFRRPSRAGLFVPSASPANFTPNPSFERQTTWHF